MVYLIDRRMQGKNKSAVNRDRFLRRFKGQVQQAVARAIKERSITDMEKGEKISIPVKDVSEPSFGHTRGGVWETISPGTRKYVKGDRVPRPSGGAGGQGQGQGGNSDETGEDDFIFELSREEFLDCFFEDLALPDLVKTQLASIDEWRSQRAGYTISGTPTNIHVLRSLRGALGRRIASIEADAAQSLKTRWPLEDMLGADLVNAALRRIEVVTGLPASTVDVDSALWLKVESFSMLQALVYLTGRLADEFEVRFVQLRLAPATGSPGKAQLDLIWSGQAMSTETVMNWELEAMKIEGESSPLTVRDVIDRHDGEMWLEREKVRHRAFFRILLPAATPQEQAEPDTYLRGESRPEYYDFDLFAWSEKSHGLEDRLLSELTFTVFDTETTGLNPSQGDEIIQIGATRIVNGRLLRKESFEQLVHPGKPIPAASIPIHGITDEMVRGQPAITVVLPAFHAFAQDTVLVAHNAAFDMKFLQLLEGRTGLSFKQPVLDTLLLSAVAQPSQESHRLEAIAERFNVTIIGRHTAMGDAMVTAEVFLKLIPLLAEKGIHTLGEAREAAQQTYYARLKY